MEASGERLEQSLLQEQTHAVEVDDGMTDVQHVHPKNAADDCTALLPYEIWHVVTPNLCGGILKSPTVRSLIRAA